MFTSLGGPSRPQIPPKQAPNPQYQQQTRHFEAAAPRTQMEAMPPNRPPPPVTNAYNSATMHPVFMMSNFRKAPFPLPPTHAFSPAATGYVFASHRNPNTTKL
ncbi:uncharacterized protein RCC_10935 [Ramularia collo-cygni]|uniref:Uncharacterized protein n=1 Tax=Ramularia collo-cygni TaxID=112498 RepID=A0A2D3V713_9PEZI|nr:uncharacterized protein RCC_10935 [Ramularia collo-cygni]CZT25206.1 uncharacterized protein RCC_10935 [Ramularia collo-cygni]